MQEMLTSYGIFIAAVFTAMLMARAIIAWDDWMYAEKSRPVEFDGPADYFSQVRHREDRIRQHVAGMVQEILVHGTKMDVMNALRRYDSRYWPDEYLTEEQIADRDRESYSEIEWPSEPGPDTIELSPNTTTKK